MATASSDAIALTIACAHPTGSACGPRWPRLCALATRTPRAAAASRTDAAASRAKSAVEDTCASVATRISGGNSSNRIPQTFSVCFYASLVCFCCRPLFVCVLLVVRVYAQIVWRVPAAVVLFAFFFLFFTVPKTTTLEKGDRPCPCAAPPSPKKPARPECGHHRHNDGGSGV
ncbi:hypothetical protein [Pandoravirus japonicus]|uniref:Uncharacterized protein n=1 Tax=Pandoravirus japonicus TaxID=2823154 RepID=A0A811BSX1_9VIRU|nr:hypothetical protein [Pandoravirus japonicus]